MDVPDKRMNHCFPNDRCGHCDIPRPRPETPRMGQISMGRSMGGLHQEVRFPVAARGEAASPQTSRRHLEELESISVPAVGSGRRDSLAAPARTQHPGRNHAQARHCPTTAPGNSSRSHGRRPGVGFFLILKERSSHVVTPAELLTRPCTGACAQLSGAEPGARAHSDSQPENRVPTRAPRVGAEACGGARTPRSRALGEKLAPGTARRGRRPVTAPGEPPASGPCPHRQAPAHLLGPRPPPPQLKPCAPSPTSDQRELLLGPAPPFPPHPPPPRPVQRPPVGGHLHPEPSVCRACI